MADDFAIKMLERAQQRSKELGIPVPASPKVLSESNSEKTGSRLDKKESHLGNPRTLVTRSYSTKSSEGAKENSDTNVEINITAPSNVQVEVEVSECDVDEFGNIIKRSDDDSSTSSTTSKPVLRDSNRSHLQRLGALYADKDISSPIHRTEQNFCEDPSSSVSLARRNKFTRLANLADQINNWEDDPSHPDYKHHRRTVNPNDKKAPTPKKAAAPAPPKPVVSPRKNMAPPAPSGGPKNINWDPKVMNQLESQGFQRRESSTTKLVYDYAKPKEVVDAPRVNFETREMPKEKPRAPQPPTTSNIRDRAALFDKRKSIFQGRDPTELSIKDRMAIFEKNKGFLPVPKVPFGQNIPAKSARPLSVHQKPVVEKKTFAAVRPVEEEAPEKVLSPQKTISEVVSETKATGMGVLSTVASLLSKGPTISEAKISEETKKQREQEMDLLLNRYKRVEDKPVPKAPPLPPSGYLQSPTAPKRRSGDILDSPVKDASSVEDSKRIKTTRLYPVLSDIESASTDQDYTTASVSPSEEEHMFQNRAEVHKAPVEEEDYDDDSYMESDDGMDRYNTSLEREILQAVQNKSTRRSSGSRRRSYQAAQQNSFNSSSGNEEVSDVLNDMDEYLEEALAEEEDSDEEYLTPTKSSISSNSFRYDSKQKKQVHYQTITEESESDVPPSTSQKEFRSPVKSELTVNPSDDNNMVTLVHTVSFYRKQQKMSSPQSATPKVSRTTRQMEEEDSESDEEYGNVNSAQVQEKIKKLLNEVCKQQTIISQTSQALNLCAATIEFSGSTESVEGERHLLVATHRRQACLDEVQRLRIEGCLRQEGAPTEKGRLTIKDITVPLKQDYIRKLAADTISGHHLVCIVKYNENVVATKTVPTLPGLLAVKFPDVITLNNVYADFKITMEIYGMTAQREILPHEVKYHIAVGKKGSSKHMTPKGKNSRLVMPPVQSPAGPNAVRTPALIQYGFIIFSLKEIQRTTWSLNSVGGVSPLEGQVHMRVNCELSVSIDYRGFLTMYEDVSGFGAWHRRWCRLHGHVMNYWLYPDDEKKKAPMGSIDLQGCITHKVTTAPRDVCARMNTFLLEFKRPAEDGDYDSLTMYRQGKHTITRRLLSADTKEEREKWCDHLNKTLALLRAWGNGN